MGFRLRIRNFVGGGGGLGGRAGSGGDGRMSVKDQGVAGEALSRYGIDDVRMCRIRGLRLLVFVRSRMSWELSC